MKKKTKKPVAAATAAVAAKTDEEAKITGKNID